MTTILNTHEELNVTTENHEENNGNGYPWYIKVLKEFGFPVATALILMSILGFVGKWMIDNQQKLIESTVKTNESLTEANRQNAATLQTMERTMAASSATVLQAIQDSSKTTSENFALNTKQVEILNGVTKTHDIQVQQIDKLNQIMESAAKLMEPVPRQREEGLKKQDETIQKLSELLEAIKKKT